MATNSVKVLMRQLLIAQGEVAMEEIRRIKRWELCFLSFEHNQLITFLEEKFSLTSIDFNENLEVLGNENTKIKIDLVKQMQETTKKD